MVSTDSRTLTVEGLTKAFDGLVAVDNVSFSLDPGTVTALVGPNGAGKSTIFSLVTGFIRPDAGRITYGAESLIGLAPHRVSLMGVGRLFQEVRPFGRMTAQENVLVACRRQPGESLFSAFFRFRSVRSSETANRQTADALLHRVQLGDRGRTTADRLSYGQQKLMAISRLLANDCRVLLLDEPTAGVNPALRPVIEETIVGLARDRRSVLLIEHNMAVVERVCSTAHLLSKGQLVASGPPQQVVGSQEWNATWRGSARIEGQGIA